MENLKIEKFWYNNGYVPYELGGGYAGYKLTTKFDNRDYEFVKVYYEDSHSDELEQKFKEEALIAFENKKKKLNGQS